MKFTSYIGLPFVHTICEVMDIMADYAVTGDLFQTNPEMKQYFDSLPPYVQETIRQTAASQITNLDELRHTAEGLLQK